MGSPIFSLTTKGLSKSFYGVPALKKVDMEIVGGEVHSLVGANGAGKSTFAKIISGFFKEYGGKIYINGEEVVLDTPHKAFDYGISIVPQEVDSALVHYFTVAENLLFSSTLSKNKFVSEKQFVKLAKEKLEEANLKLPYRLNLMARDLSVSQKQLLLIYKALIHNSRLVIFDEPTSSLGPKETEELFEIIDSLKNRGIAVLYISHRMPEIFAVSDKITVLRNGEKIGTFIKEEVSPDEVIKHILGKKEIKISSHRSLQSGEKILEASKVVNGKEQYLYLKKGEILGITGLVGAGKTELLKEIYTGSKDIKIKLENKEVKIKNSVDAVRNGIYFIPEERRKEGLLIDYDVLWNILLPSFKEFSSKLGFMKHVYSRKYALKYTDKLRVKYANLRQRVKYLSGGNQQKLIIARWLLKNELNGAKVIIFDEPTVGIDVGAKEEIYNICREIADTGIGIIFSSSDIEEVIKVADRIIVMRDNEIVAEIMKEDFSEEVIMGFATGKHKMNTF